ncbi:MAG: hypothetical protein COU90_00815 [Candidatus Ryanbacteria bacterium CG10_big_fil_rev_8_21_14_0_10_43_42]|uniref:Adenylate kinase n=1 Tax=Candidatus Ryanbacteria bacterium CG10_big_fil_rev_8_21_14_0_10_43_42 TaxID=1974864 RepID=A0A2M8KY20_9BACT|nr:MAG: hypothetical protein COU90_00815 [Candidatus Ryanbacteria bacterium CG10_big_fil_rev_8_21_14_0_10_43_42]
MPNQKPLNVFFLGLSGSGKGTQVAMLKSVLEKKYPVHMISTGDLLRSLLTKDTVAAINTKKVLDKGGLMPSAVALSLWVYKVCEDVKEGEGILFESSPRSAWEAEAAVEMMTFLERRTETRAIYLFVPEEDIKERLLKRRRHDDNEEAIKGRIAFFREHVIPAIEYFRKEKMLIEIDGSGDVDAIHAHIIKALNLA